ncbi:CPBP family intramembrane glutamic endopeptidase [Pseudoduganella violacea]|uniref:Membrane protease YdiL (CAAX protease family) n=1 Tax=Pseudoduganella violacea TaxID=1715466 RepID=A0A7W5FV95_9BURK|nr:CPBP family intramembrane glutamic endopeptidase [Pseudoduganella violacea]MBB3120755.1 membrane protease YdiL (CAAX protease family) [Pseudoduganella violacea]
MLAGGSLLLLGAICHHLFASSLYAPESALVKFSPWLLFQGLDFAVAVLGGMLAVRYSPAASLKAAGILLLLILLQILFADLPVGLSSGWIWLGGCAGPLGLALGASWYRYRVLAGQDREHLPSLLELFAPTADRRAEAAPHTGLLEALALSVLCFGIFILYSSVAAFESSFRSFDFSISEQDLLNVLLTEIVLGVLALAWLRLRRYPLATLLPRPSLFGLVQGFVLYLLSFGLSGGMVQLLSPLAAADPAMPLSRTSISLYTILSVAAINGLYEETFLLGFLLRGLRRYGMAAAFLVSLLIRALFHTYQGPFGIVSVLIFGLVLSLYYWRSRLLFPVVVAHAFTDIVPFLLS